ncbi:hypothetical protein [Streptomyces smyrnaeus]|uniref:hypothetical protein n=1 Tax=Streptomyces smyrnaeus TaxID=1387713 RepID=UPI001622E0CE
MPLRVYCSGCERSVSLGLLPWPERVQVARALRNGTVSGAVPLGAALVTLVRANTPWSGSYDAQRDLHFGVPALGETHERDVIPPETTAASADRLMSAAAVPGSLLTVSMLMDDEHRIRDAAEDRGRTAEWDAEGGAAPPLGHSTGLRASATLER